MISRLVVLLVAAIGLSMPTLAFAQDAGPVDARPVGAGVETPSATSVDLPKHPPGEAGLFDSAVELVKAVKTGNWRLAAVLLLGLLMLGLNKFRDKVKWFKGDRGGAVLVMVLALVPALAAALSSSDNLDWRLFLGAATVAWTAVGGYTWAKRLIWPKDADPAEGE